ncbi:unnamed protein product [Prorocentrum cordatum]|nr:unnamed protein product [Polarella glacialis]
MRELLSPAAPLASWGRLVPQRRAPPVWPRHWLCPAVRTVGGGVIAARLGGEAGRFTGRSHGAAVWCQGWPFELCFTVALRSAACFAIAGCSACSLSVVDFLKSRQSRALPPTRPAGCTA